MLTTPAIVLLPASTCVVIVLPPRFTAPSVEPARFSVWSPPACVSVLVSVRPPMAPSDERVTALPIVLAADEAMPPPDRVIMPVPKPALLFVTSVPALTVVPPV